MFSSWSESSEATNATHLGELKSRFHPRPHGCPHPAPTAAHFSGLAGLCLGNPIRETQGTQSCPAVPYTHSLEDLPALPQQGLQVGIAQGPVEAVPIPLGLADRGEPFAEFLWGREGNVDVCTTITRRVASCGGPGPLPPPGSTCCLL